MMVYMFLISLIALPINTNSGKCQNQTECFSQDKALSFILSLLTNYADNKWLCREHNRSTTLWIFNDNFLAHQILSYIGNKRSNSTLIAAAEKIRKTIECKYNFSILEGNDRVEVIFQNQTITFPPYSSTGYHHSPIIESDMQLGSNLILNPSVEDGYLYPDHWYCSSWCNRTCWTNEQSHTGKKSLKITANSSTDDCRSEIFNVSASKNYVFSCYVKGTVISGEWFLTLRWFKDFQPIHENFIFENNTRIGAGNYTKWTQIMGFNFTAPPNAVAADLLLRTFNGTGTLYADDFEVKEIVNPGTYIVRNDVKHVQIPNWQDYADLLLFGVLDRYWRNNSTCLKLFENATRMFDGTGLRDKAFNKTGKYETYKLALLIITAITINKTQQITMPQNLTQIIQNRQQIFGKLQRPNGGVVTHYLDGFVPDPNATENIETTCMSIYACLPDDEIPLSLTLYAQECEGRGIWVWAESFSSDPNVGPMQIRGLFHNFSEAGLNFVLFLVKNSSGWLFYNSSIGPVDPRYYWDPLKVAVEEAHRFGLELHAWFCIFHDKKLAKERLDLAMVNCTGYVSTEWVCPSKMEVRQYLKSLIGEVASKYNVDGIHLDYIRFPNRTYCCCEDCRRKWLEEHPEKPWPPDPADPTFIEFRQKLITSFIEDIRNMLKGINPKIKLSAAVLPVPKDAINNRMQNYPEWTEKGMVDFLTPMMYTNSRDDFQRWLNETLNVVRLKVPIYAGIGVYCFNATRQPELIEEQINITRTLGGEGNVFFRYFAPCEKKYCDLNELLKEVWRCEYKYKSLVPHSLSRTSEIKQVNSKGYGTVAYSNSTIVGYEIENDGHSVVIHIDVIGPNGTKGFTIVKIPDDLVNKEWEGNITVLLDDKPWPYRKTSAYTWTFIKLEYDHERRRHIMIIPEAGPLAIVSATLLITLIVGLKKHLTKKSC
jgi:uncharacterized lipoprotein YddW (UPF0748 family)